ncbi:MAG: hypothetical protein QG610_1511 [Euryarchaeota archaeon]|nr:hypothetical protein [Euryarchaeota archaeon]
MVGFASSANRTFNYFLSCCFYSFLTEGIIKKSKFHSDFFCKTVLSYKPCFLIFFKIVVSLYWPRFFQLVIYTVPFRDPGDHTPHTCNFSYNYWLSIIKKSRSPPLSRRTFSSRILGNLRELLHRQNALVYILRLIVESA